MSGPEIAERGPARLKVSDIMQRDVVTVPVGLPVGELAGILAEREISGAPVVDDDGRVLGVVSATDLVRLVSAEARRPEPDGPVGDSGAAEKALELETEAGSVSAFFRDADGDLFRGPAALAALLPPAPFGARTVRDIMMPARFNVRPSTTLPDLARFLVHARVHRALVMEEGDLKGIVTTFDVLRALAAEAVVSEPLP